MSAQPQSDPPEGIDKRHTLPHRGPAKHASVISILLLGGILAVAATGVLGGSTTTVQRESAAVRAELEVPTVLRNGEFFEMRVEVSARRPIANLGVGVGAKLWRDVTVNTMIPAATEETFRDGSYQFSFGRLEQSKRFVSKIDGQINPARRGPTEGTVDILDGDRVLLSIPLQITVLP